MPLISGEVRNAAGELSAGNIVRLYSRANGAFLGETKSSDGTGIADPFFNNVSLLLHCDGEQGSSQVIDSSKYQHQFSATNVYHSNENIVFGSNTLKFIDNNSQVFTPANDGFNFGTGDFTIELIANPKYYSYQALMSNGGPDGNKGFMLSLTDYGYYRFQVLGSPSFNLQTQAYYPINKNTHIVVERYAGTVRIYADGQIVQEGIFTSNISSDARLFIGYYENYYAYFYRNAFISELRITKGVARYKGAFQPPTEKHPDLSSMVPFGKYSMQTPYSSEVFVVCHSKDEGGVIRNDRIHRTIPI